MELRNLLAGAYVEKVSDSDNLSIVLCSYFESHTDRPDNDPDTENGWGEWAEQKADEALDLIAKQLGT